MSHLQRWHVKALKWEQTTLNDTVTFKLINIMIFTIHENFSVSCHYYSCTVPNILFGPNNGPNNVICILPNNTVKSRPNMNWSLVEGMAVCHDSK